MIIKTPFSIWMQLSSLSFFLAGNYSDLLIIRLCLSSAYICLFTNSLLGSPLWGSLYVADHIQVDGIIWACLNLYVHVSTVVQLLLDERPVLLSPEKEALWRLFFRTGGLSKRLFQITIDPYCEIVTYKQGQMIPMDDPDTKQRKWFYIIYRGQAELRVVSREGGSSTTRVAASGQLFDFKSLGFLKETLQDTQSHSKLHSAKALSHSVVLYRFPAQQMATQIACHPHTRLMWKELLMENLLRIVQRHFYKTRRERMEQSHPNNNNHSSQDIHPIFEPLQPSEEPDPLRAGSNQALRNPFQHIVKSMEWSFTPPWPFKGFPTGLRHPQHLQAKRPKQQQQTLTDEEGSKETQSLVSSSVSAMSYGSTRSKDDSLFFEYLNEMDETTGLGLNVSFLAVSSGSL